jgi:hypothetical protein
VSRKLPKARSAEYGRVFRSPPLTSSRSSGFAVFGSVGRDGDVWASIRTGEPGFLRVLDTFTVKTEPLQVEGDPLIENLRANGDVGMLIIDFATRRRMRLNGEAEVLDDHSPSRLSTPAGSRFPTIVATICSTLWETSASILEQG